MDKPLFILLLSFLAWSLSAQQSDPVNIGLLIQESSHVAARQGAELAVKIANDKGGFKGRRLNLITKGMEGPWGTGSKMAVDLIFEDDVWALLGSHDGRNSHLVEQAATKATVVFVSAWSSDPTLSQAFVPWFYNCVPTDNQQTEGIIADIYERRKLTSVALIYDNTYDSKLTLKSFLRNKKFSGRKTPLQLNFEDMPADDLINQIRTAQSQCVVFFCYPSAALKIVNLLKQKKIIIPVYCALTVINENVLTDTELKAFDLARVSCGIWSRSKFEAFRKMYLQSYGRNPGMAACFAFDGMNLLIEAIKKSGSSERELLQKALAQISYEGITGTIKFDENSNRIIPVGVSALAGGIPAEMSQ